MALLDPLSATEAILAAPFNPLVMTCAAVGAIYYGWGALSEQERTETLEKLSNGLNVGVELITEKACTTCGRNVSFNYIGSVTEGVRVMLPKTSFSVSEDFFKLITKTFPVKPLWADSL